MMLHWALCMPETDLRTLNNSQLAEEALGSV